MLRRRLIEHKLKVKCQLWEWVVRLWHYTNMHEFTRMFHEYFLEHYMVILGEGSDDDDPNAKIFIGIDLWSDDL